MAFGECKENFRPIRRGHNPEFGLKSIKFRRVAKNQGSDWRFGVLSGESALALCGLVRSGAAEIWGGQRLMVFGVRAPEEDGVNCGGQAVSAFDFGVRLGRSRSRA